MCQYKKVKYSEEYESRPESILEEAERLTSEDRTSDYGPYKFNAERAVDIYTAIRGTNYIQTAADVALFQLAHKLGREMCKHKRDNIVDACGYLKLYYKEICDQLAEDESDTAETETPEYDD